jgi:hypothetical protein
MRKLLNAIAALFRRDDCRNCVFLRGDGASRLCDAYGSRAYQGPRNGLVHIGRPYKRAECRAWRTR